MESRLEVAAQLMAALVQGSGCVQIKPEWVLGRFQFTTTGSLESRGYDTIAQIAVAMADSLIQAEAESR